jgi:hypothetical protein
LNTPSTRHPVLACAGEIAFMLNFTASSRVFRRRQSSHDLSRGAIASIQLSKRT